MIKRITIRLDNDADAGLLAALEAIPPGERNTQIRSALRREFTGESPIPDLTKAVLRLCETMSHLPTAEPNPGPTPKTSLAERMKDPAEKERIKAGLLGGF